PCHLRAVLQLRGALGEADTFSLDKADAGSLAPSYPADRRIRYPDAPLRGNILLDSPHKPLPIFRLPPAAKQLLQRAAVIGKEVPRALLCAVADLPDAPLQDSLAHLRAAEFLYATHSGLNEVYTFKHALT